MAADVEVLRTKRIPIPGDAALESLVQAIRASGCKVAETSQYRGKSPWLVLWGVGAAQHWPARDAQVARGGRALLLDLAYFDRGRYVRLSVNTDHPSLDSAPDDGSRWAAHGIALRDDSDPAGPIVLVGLGRKQRAYLNRLDWESETLARLCQRFPGRRILYKPKTPDDPLRPDCERVEGNIADVIRGASLVVVKHSNVGLDAAIAGVPFEAEAGAAAWLMGKPFTRANRLALLQRAAWFQWRADEMAEAWRFAQGL